MERGVYLENESHVNGHNSKLEEEEIKAKWGMLFVTIIIVLSIAFEKGTDYIREATPEELREVRACVLRIFSSWCAGLVTTRQVQPVELLPPSIVTACNRL